MSAPKILLRDAPGARNASLTLVRRLFVSGRRSISLAPRKSSAQETAKSLSTLRDANLRKLPEVWFHSTFLSRGQALQQKESGPGRRPEDGKVKLGRSTSRIQAGGEEEMEMLTVLGNRAALRILQERLPTLLQTPLPQEVLSPNITLHLFPTTHPHLPAVSGRVAYVAALWSSPIAWGRLPIIGNVRLEILSERMVDRPVHATTRRPGAYGEQLIVRWRTIGGKGSFSWGLPFKSSDSSQVKARAADSAQEEFTGLFIFDFDDEGRILTHTIEHVEQGGQWERGMGARVVGLTHWLLGGMKGSKGGNEPCPAFARSKR